MIRFGLYLTLRTGREALTRLLVTAAAVAVGVTLLLCVFASYRAYEATIAKPCWECTRVQSSIPTLLWRYRQDYYRGTELERVDVAGLAPTTPTLPGLSRMPEPGQFYASPALAALLATVPADQLGDRFPGTLAATIPDAALTSPEELAIVIGRQPADLASDRETLRISAINTAPHDVTTSQFYRFGFAMGGVALLIPMLVLIGTATRLAAARREERYAALRLVGATQRQIGVIASVEAVLGALAGAVVGIGGYAALHPVLAHAALIGTRFFASDITPTGPGYLGALVGVPVAAALAALVSLRRVALSPLGVSRRVTPPPPRAWRLIPLAVGLPLFCLPLFLNAQRERHNPGPAVLSLVLVIFGLVLAGPWLTMLAARLLAGAGRSGPAVLAARRLADNPRAAYRSVSGVVLAVMVGTALAAIVPAAVATESSQNNVLGNVLRASFATVGDCAGPCQQVPGGEDGLPQASATALLGKLTALTGAQAIPIYIDRATSLIDCADLTRLPTLGSCPPGAPAVRFDGSHLFTDNPASLYRRLPLIDATAETSADDPATLNLATVLVTVDDPATLERVRTLLSRDATPTGDVGGAAQTFGEVARARSTLYLEVQTAVILIAGLTLLIAGCSLAVAVSGSIVERKRPFTLLRLTGTPVRALYRVVLLETLVPLGAATVVAAGVGYLVALPVARALAPKAHNAPVPGGTYYITLGSGLLLAIAVILTCLPILRRSTVTDNVRFE